MSNSSKISNPELAHAMRELRKSSAASRHVLKKYKGTRASKKKEALRDF